MMLRTLLCAMCFSIPTFIGWGSGDGKGTGDCETGTVNSITQHWKADMPDNLLVSVGATIVGWVGAGTCFLKASANGHWFESRLVLTWGGLLDVSCQGPICEWNCGANIPLHCTI